MGPGSGRTCGPWTAATFCSSGNSRLRLPTHGLGQIQTYLALERLATNFERDVQAVLAAFSIQPEIRTAIDVLNLGIELVELPAQLRRAGGIPAFTNFTPVPHIPSFAAWCRHRGDRTMTLPLIPQTQLIPDHKINTDPGYGGLKIVRYQSDEEARGAYLANRYEFQHEQAKRNMIPGVVLSRSGAYPHHRITAMMHLSLRQFADFVRYDPSNPPLEDFEATRDEGRPQADPAGLQGRQEGQPGQLQAVSDRGHPR